MYLESQYNQESWKTSAFVISVGSQDTILRITDSARQKVEVIRIMLVARDQSTHQTNAESKDQYPMSHLFSDDDEIVNMVWVQDHGGQSWRATVVIQAFPGEGIVDSGDGIQKPFKKVTAAAYLRKKNFKRANMVPSIYDTCSHWSSLTSNPCEIQIGVRQKLLCFVLPFQKHPYPHNNARYWTRK